MDRDTGALFLTEQLDREAKAKYTVGPPECPGRCLGSPLSSRWTFTLVCGLI